MWTPPYWKAMKRSNPNASKLNRFGVPLNPDYKYIEGTDRDLRETNFPLLWRSWAVFLSQLSSFIPVLWPSSYQSF